jgi:ElaB/YqjD/DUF883 family membrane-anchored ribosome-binding protein
MGHSTGHSERPIDEGRDAVTEHMGSVEARVQETVDAVKATVESAIEGFEQLQETVGEAKAAVDAILERVQGTVQETVERMHPTDELLEYVQQNPWLLLGGAILMGYILGSLAGEKGSSR